MKNNPYDFPKYIDWKLDRIIELLKYEYGYEHISIEFTFAQIHNYFAPENTYECNALIKDGNICLLKYHTRFKHIDKEEAHVLALTEMQEKLITTIYKLAIDSLRQQQNERTNL